MPAGVLLRSSATRATGILAAAALANPKRVEEREPIIEDNAQILTTGYAT